MNDTAVKEALAITHLGDFLTDPAELDQLIKQNIYHVFAAGDIILEQGKMTDGMYVIIEGTALSTAKILGEGGTYIATLSRGNLLGEIGLIDRRPSPTTVIASSEVKCLFVSNAYYDMLAILFPETKYKITKAIASEVCVRLIDLRNKMANFIEQSDMVTRSMLGEVIKSLTKPVTLNMDDPAFNKHALHKSDFFNRFNDQEFEQLLQHAVLIKAPKQCTLIMEGEPNPPCYIVIKGAVQSSVVVANKIAKLSVFGPLSIFGSISIVDERSPAVFNYTTCERSLLLRITKEDMLFLQKNFATLWYKLFDLICQSLVSIEKSADKLDVRLKSELYNR